MDLTTVLLNCVTVVAVFFTGFYASRARSRDQLACMHHIPHAVTQRESITFVGPERFASADSTKLVCTNCNRTWAE